MVFSARNLVFVACVTFSVVFFIILCSYINFIQFVMPPFLGPFFSWFVASLVVCGARYFGLVFNLYFSFILCVLCCFCKHMLFPISCSLLLFNPYQLLVIFSFL